MKLKYGRDQKIKGNLTGDFDKDYTFLENAFARSGDIVKNVFCFGEAAEENQPAEPGKPTNQNQPAEPGKPTNQNQPAEPGKPTNQNQPAEPGKPTNQNQPAEPNKPSNQNQPAEPGKTSAQNQKRAAVIYVDGMTDADMVEDFVIRPLLRKGAEQSGPELLSYIEKKVMETVDWKEEKSLENILTDILSGNTLLLLESCATAIILSTKKYPSRGVGETEQEMVIRGPKDSFTENIRTNTALIRRRIRDPRLKMEHTMVGERSKTDLAIIYMDDLVRPQLLSQIKEKVKTLSFDGIFDGGMVEQLLEENMWSPY